MPVTTARKLQHRMQMRIFMDRISKPVERGFIPTTGVILMTAISVLIASLILTWSSDITPPVLARNAAVLVTPLNETTAAVTILNIEPQGAAIEYLIYHKTDLSSMSINTSIPVKHVGETVLVQRVMGDIEIIAVFDDSTQEVVYHGNI